MKRVYVATRGRHAVHIPADRVLGIMQCIDAVRNGWTLLDVTDGTKVLRFQQDGDKGEGWYLVDSFENGSRFSPSHGRWDDEKRREREKDRPYSDGRRIRTGY